MTDRKDDAFFDAQEAQLKQESRELEEARLRDEENFSAVSARICMDNQERAVREPSAVSHSKADFLEIYADAKCKVSELKDLLDEFKAAHGYEYGIRPDGVKNISRIYEKFAEKSDKSKIPIDILGCKIICSSLRDMYEASEKVFDFFDVMAYRDRIISRKKGGYKDLQFVINVSGHPAELKVVHILLDTIDKYEHKVYEIKRVIETLPLETYEGASDTPQNILESAQKIILDELDKATTGVYESAWVKIRGETLDD